MELLTSYQTAVENYSAAIQAIEGARGTPEYIRLLETAKEAHAKCDEARRAVATHRMDEL